MKYRLRQALANAQAVFIDPRKPTIVPVKLKTLETEAPSVRRRKVEDTAVTLAPIHISPPAPDSAETIKRFVRDEFAEAKKKGDRRAA